VSIIRFKLGVKILALIIFVLEVMDPLTIAHIIGYKNYSCLVLAHSQELSGQVNAVVAKHFWGKLYWDTVYDDRGNFATLIVY